MTVATSVLDEAAAAGPLIARTVALEPDTATDLVALLPAVGPLAWLRRGEGFVAWGEAARITTSGPDRFAVADAWWRELVRHAVVRDEIGLPGTGLITFGSFAFADTADTAGTDDTASTDGPTSALVVPEVVVGRRDGRAWMTTISTRLDRAATSPRPLDPPAAPGEVDFHEGALTAGQWRGVVAEAIARIGAGEVEKVVLARDEIAHTADPFDVRWALGRLAAAYPTCWTFHVDGLFGASPEMLVRRERGLVTSRVLAGTIRRTGDDGRDLALAATLARSSKDLEEHEYAVRSVAESLAPHCSSMNVPEAPFVLHLPNVMHLATDVAGVVHDAASVSSLQLAAALHPSAAVGGTPRPEAVALIAEIEGMDRGRYAAPVGWMDAAGDGEWAIALRSAQVLDRPTAAAPGSAPAQGSRVRLFAGCGIVASSDPDAELAEARAKLLPVQGALGSD